MVASAVEAALLNNLIISQSVNG